MARAVFISHASPDADLAHTLAAKLTLEGFDPYLAEEDSRAGGILAKKVQANLDRSLAVVVLLTPAAQASQWVQQEIGWAKARHKLTIALVSWDTDRNRLAMQAGDEYIVIDPANPEGAIPALTATLRREKFQRDVGEAVALGAVVSILVLMSREGKAP